MEASSQVKKGDVHTVVPAVANLTDPAQPLEVQVAAYSLLHTLVSASGPPRWCQLASAGQLDAAAA